MIKTIKNRKIIFTKKTYKPENNKIKKLFFIKNISNFQIFSLGANLIPYLEHNDANRNLMGSNMQKQALPLLNLETPYVGTGIEKSISNVSSFNMKVKKSGLIRKINQNKIIIHEHTNFKSNKKIIDKINFKKFKSQNIKYTNYNKRTYFLNKNNNFPFFREKAILKENLWIKKGKLLSEGICTRKNHLSIGKNILTAYMTWKGYNFEDAIVINEKLINNESFSSLQIKKYKTLLIKNETGEVLTIKMMK